ncbi:LAQU0S01e09142g1_1 [Lachancea quebecensis]|uniref:dolichol kinase n=1 Tax=Lachancea quebecensis TaxID=1654605 RepID=A0A0P1KN20_9SACH|nr:LAQU0S01e09142g1_1 [Lachancea quebecensis]
MEKQSAEDRERIQKLNDDYSPMHAFLRPEKMIQLMMLGSTIHLIVAKFLQDEAGAKLLNNIFMTSSAIFVGFWVSYRTRVANNGTWSFPLLPIATFVPDFNVVYVMCLPTMFSLIFARSTTIVNLVMSFNCADLPLAMKLPVQALFVLLNDDYQQNRTKNFKAIFINCIFASLIEKIGHLKSFDRVDCNLFSICLTNVLYLLNRSSLHFQILHNVLKGFMVAVSVNYLLSFITTKINKYLRSAILLTSFVGVFPLTILYSFEIEGHNPAGWLYNYILQKSTRVKIILGWLGCLLLLVPNIMTFQSSFSLDTSRKLWHFIILVLIVPPLHQDPEFVKIALAGTIVLFLSVEYLRYLKLAPFGEFFDSKLRSFADFRDERGPVIISYIYLIIGVATPILINGSLVGVISLGVGDSLASIVGYRWGRHRWPGTSKTFEGTFAFIAATSVCSLALKNFNVSFQDISNAKLILTCILSGILEGNSVLNDNILVPAFMLIVSEGLK